MRRPSLNKEGIFRPRDLLQQLEWPEGLSDLVSASRTQLTHRQLRLAGGRGPYSAKKSVEILRVKLQLAIFDIMC